MSSQIALLERQLGFKLFSRTSGRKPSITPRGLAFLADLKTFDDAGRALAAHRVVPAAQGPASHFRIHIGEILFNQFIRPRLGRFLSDHPTIECEFDARPPSRELSADREKHGFDFALFHHRADQPWFEGARPLALVRGGIYGVSGFASPGGSLTAEQVSALPFIMPKAGSTAERDHLASLSAAGIIPRNIICHSEYFDVMAAMVERGLGVACLTDSLLTPQARTRLTLLFPLTNWELLWIRRPPRENLAANLVEEFLLGSILDDPDYPAIEKYPLAAATAPTA